MQGVRETSGPTLLVVDDDLVAQARLNAYFTQEGYRVLLAGNGVAFWQALGRNPVDLVLLDVNLPGQDGLSLARDLRARNPSIGIILVTSRSDDVDKVVGLEVGADDYVTKPFNPRELLARVKSLLRRTGEHRPAESEDVFGFAGWTLDLPRRRLCDAGGRELTLTRGEFEVLALLVRHPGEVIDRDRLSRAVSGRDWAPQDRTIDVLVRRLRGKIDEGRADSLIVTVRGEGYRLAVDSERRRA
ncbi:MAG: response regulator [Thauera phenolivorans]|uniref:Response regulator n=1 Tax=Thauera phenolivorans TaxID=1792543 RepID=A0A7X7LY23_9RHOO|nr:response regulator [Thauera phenolivorans]